MFRFLFYGARNIIFGKFKIGQNNPEIANLEFESHVFLENHASQTYLDMSQLFLLESNILSKQHIVQCNKNTLKSMLMVTIKLLMVRLTMI